MSSSITLPNISTLGGASPRLWLCRNRNSAVVVWMGARHACCTHYSQQRFVGVKIEQEKRVVERMIRLYCRKYEGNAQLCDECQALLEYAHARLSRCKYGDAKTTCKRCPVHCYKPQMREQIRRVMRYAGPRMLLYYPKDAFVHMVSELKEIF